MREQRVSITHETTITHEISMHLGDILPQDLNYSTDENAVIKVTIRYSDPYGRPRSKSITLPAQRS